MIEGQAVRKGGSEKLHIIDLLRELALKDGETQGAWSFRSILVLKLKHRIIMKAPKQLVGTSLCTNTIQLQERGLRRSFGR